MRRGPRIAVGAALGLLLTWLLFRATDWSAVWGSIREVHLGWLLLAQVLSFAAHFARVQRWSYVVRAAWPARYGSLFGATQIGFLVNAALPARLGELVRAYVLAKLERRPVSGCLSMVALDRAGDLVGLLAVVLVALLAYPVNESVEVAAGAIGNSAPFTIGSEAIRVAVVVLTAFVLAVLGGLVFAFFRQGLVLAALGATVGRVSRRLGALLARTFRGFAEGMHVFRSPAELAKSLASSMTLWLANALSLAATLEAFAIDQPWYASCVLLALIAIGISVPVAPGMIGQYHAGVIVGLLLAVPAIEVPKAQAVAIVTHVAGLFPIALLGLVALSRERLSFLDLVRRGADEAAPDAPR